MQIHSSQLKMTELSSLLLDPEDAKLLVIDAQNDVCHSDSDYAHSESHDGKQRDVKPIQETVKNGIIPFLARAREHGLPIGFVQSIYRPGQYLDVSPTWLTIESGLEDPEWRIRIYGGMHKQGESIFKKDTQNSFRYKCAKNGLADWLTETKRVLVAGFLSYGCIKKCVEELLRRGDYVPVVLEDCIGASKHRKAEHEQTLAEYKADSRIEVMNSRNVNFRSN